MQSYPPAKDFRTTRHQRAFFISTQCHFTPFWLDPSTLIRSTFDRAFHHRIAVAHHHLNEGPNLFPRAAYRAGGNRIKVLAVLFEDDGKPARLYARSRPSGSVECRSGFSAFLVTRFLGNRSGGLRWFGRRFARRPRRPR